MKKIILIVVVIIAIIISGVYLVYSKKNISNESKIEEIDDQSIDYGQDIVQEINNEENIEENKENTKEVLPIKEDVLISENKVENKAENEDNFNLVKCLYDAGLRIYGSRTCPYCTQLVENFGGYEAINLIYIECMDNRDKCINEMKSNYVPEIQINGEIYDGGRSLEELAKETNCFDKE